MSQTADVITRLIAEAAPKIAVVFSGAEPRLLGTLDSATTAATVKARVDSMLFSQHLSATYISIAQCRGATFVAAHS